MFSHPSLLKVTCFILVYAYKLLLKLNNNQWLLKLSCSYTIFSLFNKPSLIQVAN